MEKEIRLTSSSNKGPLIGIFLLLITIAGYVFITKPLQAKLNEFGLQISEKTTELGELSARLDFLDKAEKDLDLSTAVRRKESLKAVPEGMNQDEVIKDLIKIAENNDIELSSISFAKSDAVAEGIGNLRISASFEGDYLDLTDFLEGLEENGRIFKVDSISVQLSKLEINDVERANFSLSIQTFFQN